MDNVNSPLDKLPEGCKHLFGSLYVVPFAIIRTPVDNGEGDGYKFSNPRINTEKGQQELLDKKLSAELRESIKKNTLLNPLVCRFVEENGKFYPQVIGGDRRHRALDFIIRKKEIVTDPRNPKLDADGKYTYSQVPANEAYEYVPCQIFSTNTDLDALALAWAENKSRVNLSEGAEVAEVIKLRKHGASDERILEILVQDEKWLKDSDSLISQLDVNSLADLLEGRLDRKGAMELSTIEDLTLREKVRVKSNEAAQEACDKKYQRYQRQVEAALTQQDIAEGSVVDAEFREDNEDLTKAKGEFSEAEKKVKRTTTERDSVTPVAQGKDVKVAKAEVIGGEEANGKEKTPKMLRASQIRTGLAYIEAVIKKGGVCPDGSFISGERTVEALALVRKILVKNVLGNDSDFSTIIRRHVKKQDIDEEK